MINKWPARFELVRAFAWVAVGGLALGFVAIVREAQRIWTTTFAVLLLVPLFCYVYVLVIWHWKDRYRGRHSDLWGLLILIETSGWFKLVYIFRHLVPDMRHSGRYRIDSANLVAEQPPVGQHG
jgi:hypothetical protein